MVDRRSIEIATAASLTTADGRQFRVVTERLPQREPDIPLLHTIKLSTKIRGALSFTPLTTGGSVTRCLRVSNVDDDEEENGGRPTREPYGIR